MKAEGVVAEFERLAADCTMSSFAERRLVKARAIRALIEERDALRTLLATARAHLLGAGDGYENEVILAIDAALGDKS